MNRLHQLGWVRLGYKIHNIRKRNFVSRKRIYCTFVTKKPKVSQNRNYLDFWVDIAVCWQHFVRFILNGELFIISNQIWTLKSKRLMNSDLEIFTTEFEFGWKILWWKEFHSKHCMLKNLNYYKYVYKNNMFHWFSIPWSIKNSI